MVFFEMPDLAPDPDRNKHPRLQHSAFEVHNFDQLLGTYLRLKGLGILPIWAADHGMATSFYYQDPDQNIVEINVNHYGDEWEATEHMKTSTLFARVYVDPEKMVEARKKGAFDLGAARARRCRRVLPLEAVRSPQKLLNGITRPTFGSTSLLGLLSGG